MTGNQHRFVITLPDGTEYREIPSNQPTLTEKLVEDDTGAYYYEKEMSRLRYTKRTGEVYAALKALEDSADRCEECTVEYYVASGGQWVKKYTGVFSMSHCRFIIDKCEVSFEPEEQSVYRCLRKAYDEEHNILEIDAPVTVKKPTFGDTFFTTFDIPEIQNTFYQFYVTDGTVGQEPYNNGEIGYNSDNQLSVTLGGNNYEIFWRAVFYLECGEEGCVASGSLASGTIFNYQLISDTCADSGSCLYAITSWELLGNTFNILDQFTQDDFQEVDDQDDLTTPGVEIADGIYGIKLVYYLYDVQNETDFSNGRTLADVLDYLASLSCADITTIKSNFFKINADGDSQVLTGDPDKYANIAIYQITDVIVPGATLDATIGMMSLKTLLTELSVLKLRWRIEGGDTLRIEHVEDFISTTSDSYTGVVGQREYEYDRGAVPKRETFSALHQRNSMFVGTDIEYSGACVGDDVQNNRLSQFTFDLGFVQTHPEEIASEGFFMMNYEVFGSENYLRNEVNTLNGESVPNGALGWAFILPLIYLYQAPASGGNINSGSFTADSETRLRKARLRLTNANSGGKFIVDTSALFVSQLGTGVIDEVQTELHTMRATVQYRF